MFDSAHTRLDAQFRSYFQRWPSEKADEAGFIQLLTAPDRPFSRERLAGHFTASAWLVSADGQRTLLTHHKKLDRWLQPGGHADGDPDLGNVALKEALEESGVVRLNLEDQEIFDLDRHWIPTHKEVPGHWHFDVRYVVRATTSEAYVVSEESHDLAWRPVHEIAQAADQSLQRMARKWLRRLSGQGA